MCVHGVLVLFVRLVCTGMYSCNIPFDSHLSEPLPLAISRWPSRVKTGCLLPWLISFLNVIFNMNLEYYCEREKDVMAWV